MRHKPKRKKSRDGAAERAVFVKALHNAGFRNGPLVVKSLVSTSPIYGAPRERAVDCAAASARLQSNSAVFVAGLLLPSVVNAMAAT